MTLKIKNISKNINFFKIIIEFFFIADEKPWLPLTRKNTDKDMYFGNKKTQHCVVCDKIYKRHIVHHYKMKHADIENFASRLSNEMAILARNGNQRVERHLKRSLKYIKTICFFCEQEKDFSTYYWSNHIRSHTGEYANQCLNCEQFVCYRSHCGSTTANLDEIDVKIDDLNGFICLECNFMQIDEKNLQKHIINEHGIYLDLNEHYEKILILPSWTIKEQQNDSRNKNTTSKQTF